MDPLFWLYWLAAFVLVVSVLAILAVAFEGERMTAENRMLQALWAIIVLVVVLAVGSVALATWAFAHDHARPEFDWWYETLMMPDNPSVRCCGKDDEYRCDAFVRDGETWCRVTDDRVVPNRPVVPVGTEILIPRHKYKFDQGNPTGHTLVFGRPSGGDFYVYCFVQGTGI